MAAQCIRASFVKEEKQEGKKNLLTSNEKRNIDEKVKVNRKLHHIVPHTSIVKAKVGKKFSLASVVEVTKTQKKSTHCVIFVKKHVLL